MKCFWILCLGFILSYSDATLKKSVIPSNGVRIVRQVNGATTELSEAAINDLITGVFGGVQVASTSSNSPFPNPTTATIVGNTVTEANFGGRVPVPPRESMSSEGTGNNDGDCKCVPYFLCNTNRTIIESGEGLIDIRLKGECDYLEVCCSAEAKLDPSQPINPTPSPTPPSYNPTNPPPTQACGKRNIGGVSSLRITGAEDGEAQFGEFPWMVAIIRKDQVNEQQTLNVYQCGGSLIHPQVVLTAAHCIQGKTGLSVRVGEWDTQRTNEPLPTQNRLVRDVVIHEEFYPTALFNDVALLFLDTPVNIAPNIGLICLPEQGENMDNRQCVASGWGKDVFGREGKYQVILKKVELPTVQRDKCQQALRQTKLGGRFKLHTSFLCAGGVEGKDTCRGDGGSPLVCPSRDNPNVYVQAGIVAWGVGCGTETPGVYVDIAKFRNWIDNKLSIFNIDPRDYKN